MSDHLFCISHDEKAQVRNALIMIDLIRRRLQRDSYTQSAAVDLQTHTKVIARIVDQLPPDPRNILSC